MPVRLIDTTLRDGSQRPGMCWSRSQRLWFASRLAQLPWVSELEAGVPAASLEEAALVEELAGMNLPCDLTAWNRMRQHDIRISMKTGVRRIHITVPASRLHLQKKLAMEIGEAAALLTRLSAMAKEGGHLVSVGLEDASRADLKDLVIWVAAGLEGGADRFRLADTVGLWHPRLVVACVLALRERMGPVELAVHTHNDLGMACANALAAVEAGVSWVDVTVCGVGERAGNCSARDLLPLLGLPLAGLQRLEQSLSLFNPNCMGHFT
jgi:homocitrate synthase NifV